MVGFSLADAEVNGPEEGVLSFSFDRGDSVQLSGTLDDISYTLDPNSGDVLVV